MPPLKIILGILFLTTHCVLSTETKPEAESKDSSKVEVKEDTVADDLIAEASEILPVPQALIQNPPEGGRNVNNVKSDISPADELRRAAERAGYNISDVTLQLAASGTDEELTESLPQPLAQALIDRRRLPDLRDRLIGMTFLGQPVPLDYRQRRRPFMMETRRRLKVDGLRRPLMRRPNEVIAVEAAPGVSILKPMSLSGTRTRIILPDIPGFSGIVPSKTRKRPQQIRIQVPITEVTNAKPPRGFPLAAIENNRIPVRDGTHFRDNRNRPGPFRPNKERLPRPTPPQQSEKRPFFEIHETSGQNQPGSDVRRPFKKFPPINDNFGNSVGPDFGPVFDMDHNSHTNNEGPSGFMTFDSAKIPPPDGPFPPRVTASSHNRIPFTARPRPATSFKPSKPFSPPGFANFGGSPESQNPIPSHILPRDPKSRCNKYTETICLDADNYPHAQILDALEGDKSRANGLIAEVKDQSADDLVDGVSAREEERYNYDHYFGGNPNRREDSDAHRDFADDGGYLCPSEVKYARPKRARNSKGDWKFIVNMDKYSQTIRMEKCIQPGGSCSYVSHHYKAMCNQVHNYQRLLAWEKKRGLHMDIFKVPSCCTCHIQGYSFSFPPFNGKKKTSPPHPLNRGRPQSNNAKPHQPPPSGFSPHDSRRPPGHPQSSRRPLSPFDNFRNRRPHQGGPPLDNEIRRIDADMPDLDRLDIQRTRMPLPNFNDQRRMVNVDEQQHRGEENERSILRRMDTADEDFRSRSFDRPSRRMERDGPTGFGIIEHEGPTSGPDRMERGFPSGPSRMNRERSSVRPKLMKPDSESSREYVEFNPSRQPNRGPGTIGKRQVNYNYHPISQFFSDYEN